MQVNRVQFNTNPNLNFQGTVSQKAENIITRLYQNSKRKNKSTETIDSLKRFLENSHKDNVFDILVTKNGDLQAIIKNTKLNVKVTPIKSILPMLYENNPEIVNKFTGSTNIKVNDIAGIYKLEKFLFKLENFTDINFSKDKINREIYSQSVATLKDDLRKFRKVLSKEQLKEISKRLANFGKQQLQQSCDEGYVYKEICLCQHYRDDVYNKPMSKKSYFLHRIKVVIGFEKPFLLEKLLANKI